MFSSVENVEMSGDPGRYHLQTPSQSLNPPDLSQYFVAQKQARNTSVASNVIAQNINIR